MNLVELLALTDQEIVARHGRWYLPERNARWVRRNALVALGNAATPHDPAATAILQRYADGPDELLAEHACWARARLAERAGHDVAAS